MYSFDVANLKWNKEETSKDFSDSYVKIQASSLDIYANDNTDDIAFNRMCKFYNSIYEVYSDKPGWIHADNTCKSKGGHLATITSEIENKSIYNMLKEKGYQNAYF